MTNLSNDIITVVRDPKNMLGKRFEILDDGSVVKAAEVNLYKGEAIMHHVPDADALAKLLAEVSNDPHAAIVNSSFKGVDVGELFLLYSEDLLCREFALAPGRENTKGIHQGKYKGNPIKITGRLKENVEPSSWQYIDRDIDKHTPEKYAVLDQTAYMSEVDKILPGFTKADKVITGSTSARVLKDGHTVGKGNGHIWFKLDKPSDVERIRVASMVQAAKQSMTWLKPRYSKTTGVIVRHSLTTILDDSVFTPGRLIFVGKPVCTKGLVIADQSIKVMPGDQRSVDSSLLILPDDKSVREITKAAGVELSVSTLTSGGLVTSAADLSMDLELDTKDYGVITVAEALEKIVVLKLPKIKCQTPFRDSSSLAAFLAVGADGWPFIYDVGTSTKHKLPSLEICRLEFSNPCEENEDPPPCLESHLVDFLHDEALEFMPHVVDLWVPCDEVTLLAGHGGGGKSYISLSLAVHVALGLSFGGLATKQSKVLFFSGEDGSAVLTMRLAKLCRELNIDRSQLVRKLHILDVSDIDPALHRDSKGSECRVRTETKLLDSLSSLVTSLDVGLVIIDNASDAYDDDEIKRARVRTFVRSLRSKLARPGRAVLLLVHVNKASASLGKRAGSEDYSGSTAWHNSARSRLSLTTSDSSITIEHSKANLGIMAEPVMFEWRNGVPVAQINSASDLKVQADNERIAILSLIAAFNKRGELVTTSTSGSATVYHLLHTEPGYPVSLHKKTSDSSASSRLNTLCRRLVDDGLIRRVERKTNHRKDKECYDVTDAGHRLLEADNAFLL